MSGTATGAGMSYGSGNMPFKQHFEHEVQAPIQIRVPKHMQDADAAEYWRLIADHMEELTRSCVFCNFTAKHRGSLRRHMVKMHNMKQ